APAAWRRPWAMTGGAGVVYRLEDPGGRLAALKVFHPSQRQPNLVHVAEALRPLAQLPGMQACDFKVLHTLNHPDLLREHPQLSYAMLMPWIPGPSWQEVLIRTDYAPSAEECLRLALGLVDILLHL